MKNVLVLFGGCSPEHEVSLQSARSVLEHMDREKFRPLPVGITRQGRWLLYEGPPEAIGRDRWEQTGPCAPALLSPSRGERSLWILGPAGLESTAVDLAFPVLHGRNGEDGTVQGLVALAGIPLAGCGVLSSALCMDKDRAHRLAALAGLRVPRSAQADRSCPPEELRALGEALGWPLFVKPLRAGSSFGVSRVERPEDLPGALERALAYDSRALLEEAVPGVELGVAVLGTARPRAFGPDEVELAGGFFDYAEKYGLLTSRIHVPARIAPAQAEAALRRGGIRGELLVLGVTHESSLPLAAENGLILTVPDLDAARRMDAQGVPVRAHLAIDTGMRRLGERAEETERLEAACRCKNIRVEGAFTHLCTEDGAFSHRQGQRFWAAVAALRARGISLSKPHLLNSYGLLRSPELGGTYARTGLALYGYAGEGSGLEPVLALKARIGAVRTLQEGESAGYGLCFRARRETRLALLPIGYADGLPRALSQGRGGALVRGRFAPFAGALCMDQCLLDVTDVPGVCPGEEAVLLGASGPARQDARDLARAAGTIPNEILSRLGPRLPRIPVG